MEKTVDNSPVASPLWQPSQEHIANSNLFKFMRSVEESHSITFHSYWDLYSWSVREAEQFWLAVRDFCELKGDFSGDVIENYHLMPGAKFFPSARLNFAENLLRYRDDHPAIIFHGETENITKRLSYRELYIQTARLASSLRGLGIKEGDRVAGYIPNIPEAVIGMLGTTSLGGVWSACSPDFGVEGVVDRFGQIAPRVLIVSDGYIFKGQKIDILKKAEEIRARIPSIEKVVVVPFISYSPDISAIEKSELFERFCDHSATEITFTKVGFNDPLYIVYSSGTTGKPKCIVHGVGGITIEHAKEHFLHCDLKREDITFYQTTCGWMMWNFLVSSLMTGATIALYDGSPLEEGGGRLWELASKDGWTVFGTNAKYLSLIEKLGVKPKEAYDLTRLRLIMSTGSVLLPESFDYVYRDIKNPVQLASISGGTDILGCFAQGCPIIPIYRGELQTRGLGLRVEVFNQSGVSVQGEKGELVCTAPFPSMPIYFWNDPSGERYREAYFSRFPNVWHHGDYVELTKNNGMIFYGRSDSTLNPGGVRIGTAEIYRQAEKLPEIEESLVIAQEWDGDVRIVLFVKLKDGATLSDSLKERIRSEIRRNTSPYHVPKKIVQVPDIPKTKNQKIAEIAVRDTVAGQSINNTEALLNPEAVEYFRDIPELRE